MTKTKKKRIKQKKKDLYHYKKRLAAEILSYPDAPGEIFRQIIIHSHTRDMLINILVRKSLVQLEELKLLYK